MAKQKKPTPQELYWERKRREEEEKEASLPPGLINHGNTCFMNSTLQGLIATQPLRDLVFFHDVPPALQPSEGSLILAKRSPQLTNGHGVGGPDELAWSEGMPLGDIFTTIMRKAWGIQDAKRRETMSPKEILGVIGRKYDQYLDFRQQDAHEFLRHMLDAMRMEELDIIKKRQPLPPQTKRERHSRESNTPLPSPSLPPSAHPIPSSSSQASQSDSASSQPSHIGDSNDGEKLESFVDMLFGGQLASILVCDRCKKVSLTYEAFNDLSLSIKPEDYAKNRKRDRFKRIARKLRIRPPERDRGDEVAQRASSVPSSPVRRSSEVADQTEPPTHEDPRRRSFDHAGAEADEARDVVKEMVGVGVPPTALGSAIVEDEEAEEITHAEAAEAEAEGAANESGNAAEEKPKDKKDDSWGKIARRISVSMKLGGTRDKDRASRPSSRQGERGRKTESKDALRAIRSTEPRSSRTASLAPDGTAHDVGPDPAEMSDPGRSRAPSPGRPTSPSIPNPLIQERSRPSSSRRSSTNPFSHHHHHRKEAAKTSAYMSDEDMAYIRRVLADVHPVTGNPLSILQNAFSGSANGSSTNLAGSTTLATQALWAKIGHLPGIEECLRMFTAVEILDGENMVGCHRCWKIANGLYTPPPREPGSIPACLVDDSDDSESEESDEDSDERPGSSSASADDKSSDAKVKASVSGTHPVVPGLNSMDDGTPQSSPELSSGQVSPASTSAVSAPAAHSSSTTSVSSAPTTVETSVSPTEPIARAHSRKDSVVPLETYVGIPIPKISTTEPETPGSAPAGQTFNHAGSPSGVVLSRTLSTPGAVQVSQSNDSLLTPRARRKRAKAIRNDGIEESEDSSDDEFDDSESDTSAPTYARSDGSVSPSISPSASPNSSVEKLGDVSPLASLRPHHHRRREPGGAQLAKVPRAKQVVLRKMYKRYLISTPPPILVIHLKRFQQSAKVHHISLSGGFKKLDDFVAFPEQLDLAPFLAPKRQDFTHDPDKAEKHKEKGRPKERCMYRLYAVVVHIGNMLGGHYVAYAALPQGAPPPPPTPAVESEKLPATPSLSSQESRSSQATAPQRHPRQWAYVSDTVVRLATLQEVLKAKAYICMYERV